MSELIPQLTMEQYKSIPAMNASTLVHGLTSMYDLKRAIDGFNDYKSGAMSLGTVAHVLVLEPFEFQRRFVVMPDFASDPENVTQNGTRSYNASTTYVKTKVAEFEASNPGKEIVKRTEYETAKRCIESLNTSDWFVDVLSRSNKEVALTGEIEGVPFKGRVDMLATDCIVDVKTAASVGVESYGNSHERLHYTFRMAIYRELVRQATGSVRPCYMAVVSTSNFDRVIYRIPDFALDIELERVRAVLRRYKQCLESNEWTGIDNGNDIVELYLPYAAQKRYDEAMGDVRFKDVDPVEVESKESEEVEIPF